jgi:hypothetical protein
MGRKILSPVEEYQQLCASGIHHFKRSHNSVYVNTKKEKEGRKGRGEKGVMFPLQQPISSLPQNTHTHTHTHTHSTHSLIHSEINEVISTGCDIGAYIPHSLTIYMISF